MYAGILFAMTTTIAGELAVALVGLYRASACVSDCNLKIIMVAVPGGICYLAVLVNLLRLRKMAEGPAKRG